MEIAKQFVELAKIGAEERWSAEKIARRSSKLFESLYADKHSTTQNPVGPVKITNVNISNTYNTAVGIVSKTKLRSWIKKHPPERTTVTKYYTNITREGFAFEPKKIDKLMKAIGYQKKRFAEGVRWVDYESDSSSDSSSDSDSD